MANEKKVTWKQAWAYQARAMKLTHELCPGRMASGILRAVFTALSPYVTIWFSARFINELAGLRRPELLWQWALLTLGITALLGIGTALIIRWAEIVKQTYFLSSSAVFFQKYLDMDYVDVEDSRLRDLRKRIANNENWGGWGHRWSTYVTENLLHAVLGILSTVALTVSLFTSPVPESAGSWQFLNNPLFALALIALAVPITWLTITGQIRREQEQVKLADYATQGNRKFFYCLHFARGSKRHLDVRAFRQEKLVGGNMFMDDTWGTGGPFDRLNRGPYGIMEAVGKGLNGFYTGVVYLFTCLKAWGGAFGVGSVTQYVGAVTTLSKNISELMSALGSMRANAAFLEDTFTFLDTPNKMYQGSLTTEKRSDRQYEVEFRNVSFKYPGSENWALKNISLKFKVGSRLAIVGENGSGKTTFIKLLCRLYDPDEGEILLNGIDIRKYRYDDYMNIFSVVFQDFELLSLPLGQNVAGSEHYDREKARDCLEKAGFGERLETMSLDTYLFKELDKNGVEVSGGEAQKIAIARALYKDAPFIILDEPTAALDPMAEAEIYEKFDGIAGDKTAIYISHRLSSCKFCDEIAVFHQGQMIQQGTHETLLAEESGKYHALWFAQAQYYTEE